ncbi:MULTISPECIES: hypothetical protein [Pseudomonas]|jgi:hypothetical protein|uniref:Uncharacterized protein n=1 Tax=Pseudomonas neuropathica TaxID=2730425 RepID=A0ACC7N5C5_9PSED|nr:MULTISPECIES: hypothetical protein [Pseudomonas]MDD2104488.1 hypothetical protein [Pseudomonas putida]MEB2626679.1 hypothetical protein [Pseudomonas sp. YuFO8]
MKNIAKIEIFEPGMVVFDPVALNDFIINNGITSSNLLDCFLNSEKLGLRAVEEGVVFPLYQIPEMEYSIFLKGVGQKSSFSDSVNKFCYSGIPLKVVSGLVVVADLNALMDWDSEFFLGYRDACVDGLGNNDYLDVENGLYDLSISGFKGLNDPFVSLGYELEFTSVGQLPKLSNDASTDDWDFSIV